MNSNGINFNADHTCPDPQTLVRYQQGLLSPAEQHQLEAHLLDCEFCADALEGIQLMDHPGTLLQVQQELNERIEKRTGEKKEAIIVRFPAFRIAAMLVIVLIAGGLIWYLRPDTRQEQIVLDTQEPNTPVAEPLKESPADASPSNESLLSAATNKEVKDEKAPIVSAPAQQAVEENSVQESNAKYHMEEVAGVAATETENETSTLRKSAEVTNTDLAAVDESVAKEEQKELTKKKVESTHDRPSSVEAVSAAPRVTSKGKQAAEAELFNGTQKDKSQQGTFNTGLELFREGRYQEALPYLTAATDIPESRLYTGISYYQLNNQNEALKALDKYVTTASGKKNDEAWWYKALVHLKLNNRDATRKALLQVIELKGGYQQRAEELLRKI